MPEIGHHSRLLDRGRLRRLAYNLSFCATASERRRFLSLSLEKEARLKDSITNWLRFSVGHEPGEEFDRDLEDHLSVRMTSDRLTTIPWIAHAQALEGARVLEIEAGTGASTVAFAEQGAAVTAIDIDASSLEVARTRCELYGIDVAIKCMNGTAVGHEYGQSAFDVVVFFASIEHMTYEERQKALQAAWATLRPGGIPRVTGTPNRLWHYDFHTSRLLFFNWLPDELAMRVANKSRRKLFANAALDSLSLARWGRGFSYHEIELALGDLAELQIRDNRVDFIRRRSPLPFLESLISKARRYERALERLYPQIDRGFFRLFVDVLIRKPS